MVDRNKLADGLTDLFIDYQFRLDHPMLSPDDTLDARRDFYRRDHMFHAKVRNLVAGVMNEIDKHI